MAKTDAGDCAVLAASVDQIIKSLENTIKFYRVIIFLIEKTLFGFVV
jgi:hypothetical protein